MQIRLYIDEDAMARAFVQGLRARGVDLTTVIEAGMNERDDREQLQYSTAHGRVLYTFNVGHFCNIHKSYMTEKKSHSGIIVVNRQRYSVGEQIRRLLSLIGSTSGEDMIDSLRFL